MRLLYFMLICMYALRHSCITHSDNLHFCFSYISVQIVQLSTMIACSVCRYVVIIVLCTVLLTIMCEYCIALQNLQLTVGGDHPLVATRMQEAVVTLNRA